MKEVTDYHILKISGAQGCEKFPSFKYLQVSLWKWEIWSY